MNPVQGSDMLVLSRLLGQKVDADKVFLAREFKISSEADSDSVDTFDGSFETGGSKKTTVGLTALMNREDKLAEDIEQGLGKVRYELWIIDSKAPGKNGDASKFRARYLQGIFKKFDQKIEVGNSVEYEVEFNESGGGMKYGYATLPESLKSKLEASGYKFHDTTASDPGEVTAIPQPKQGASTPSTGVSAASPAGNSVTTNSVGG